MSKLKSTDGKYEQSAADESVTVGSDTSSAETVKQSEEILLTFKENRFYELHIGRNIIPFTGRETKKVDKLILSHKDWTPAIAAKFITQEIK